jgi:hypothetical protein
MFRFDPPHELAFGFGQSPADLLDPEAALILLNGHEIEHLDGYFLFGGVVHSAVD